MPKLRNTRIAQFLLWCANRLAPGLWVRESAPPVTAGSGIELCTIRDERVPGRRKTDGTPEGFEVTLSYDNSRCRPNHSGCDIKETCARYTEPGRPQGFQSVLDASVFAVDGELCALFIANGEKVDDLQT